MASEPVRPRALAARDFKFNGIDRYVPDCNYTEIVDAEGFGGFGLYFMPPGAQTTVVSLESEDDATADEDYGPCFEFYYVLSGEITMYWGKDAERVRRGEEGRLQLAQGDFGCWEKEWKFSAKNTGEVPASFFWGLAEAQPGVIERLPGS
jgi:mannose-6-phosphate isomerase-like protein (cupin superfamily)